MRDKYPDDYGTLVGTVESFQVYGDEWVMGDVGEIWQFRHRHDYHFRYSKPQISTRGGGVAGCIERYHEGATCPLLTTVPDAVREIRREYAQMYGDEKLLRVKHGMD